MELTTQELRVVGDLLGREVEIITDWFHNDGSFGEFKEEFISYNRMLDNIERQLGVEFLWNTELYKSGRKYYKERFNKPYRLGDEGVEVDNRDSSETWVMVEGKRFVITRIDMDNVLKMGWGEDESQFLEVEGVKLELFPSDYRYLLENLKENNPEG